MTSKARLGVTDRYLSPIAGDEHTLFHMASVTKPFVATAVMQLSERGLVDLEAPLRTYYSLLCPGP
jgi:CubicO group peptidase (beta-lactamase class C family)